MKNKHTNTVCGSRLGTVSSDLSENVKELIEYVEQERNNPDSSLAEKHNIYTAYTVLMMLYGTGHRPVIDMFAYREDIDLTENIVMINDKVSSEATKNRVCWFSDLIKQQIQAYFLHIESLAKILHEDHYKKELAGYISALQDPIPAIKQSMPLFFFLDDELNSISISPSLLFKQLENQWPYHQDNHSRHCIENSLYDQGIARTLIDIQTGHQQIQDHLLGENTNWTAFECSNAMIPALNSIADIQGWKAINGIHYENNTAIEKKHGNTHGAFGHLRRQEKRKSNLKKLEETISDIVIGEINKSGGIDSYINQTDLQKESIRSILSECSESSEGSQAAIQLFISEINKLARKHNIRQIKKVNLVKEEASPFPDHWLGRYVSARSFRYNYINYLKERIKTNKKQKLDYLWAEIVISAILFSGLYKKEWISYLSNTGPKGLNKIKKWVYFIDIWADETLPDLNLDYQSPSWRWQPDPLSRNLIRLLFDNTPDAINKNINSQNVLNCIREITHQAGIDIPVKSDPISYLCTLSEPYWLYHFPSFINKIFQSKAKTTPLPQRCLARLCYESRLSIDLPNSQSKEPIYLSSGENENKKNLKEYLLLIKSAINLVQAKIKNNKPLQRSELTKHIFEAHNKYFFPNIALALSQWLIHFIANGAARGEKLAIGTIDNYFFSIANPLCIYIGDNNIENYSEQEISEIYKKTVNFNGTDQGTRASQLIQFNYIIGEYSLADFDNLDWTDIAGQWLKRRETRVDANIVTPKEYEQCLHVISKSRLDPYTKSWSSLFLILGYRFGLRIGEAHHLRLQDIQIWNDEIIIQVQRTIEGQKKSLSAIRQVPLLGTLSIEECKIIHDHIRRIKKTNNATAKTPLFRRSATTNQLIDRGDIWKQIHSILRHVTGDPRIRYHHLRHSFSTGQFVTNMDNNTYRVHDEIKCEPWTSYQNQIKTTLVDPKASQAYILSSLSSAVGHAQIRTTLHSYIHLVDDIVIGYATKAPVPNILRSDLADFTQHNKQTIEARIRSKNLNNQSYSVMDILATIQISNLIPAYSFKQERFPESIPIIDTKRNISLIDIFDVLYLFTFQKMPINDIAYTQQLDKSKIDKIIKLAKAIETDTLFHEFGLQQEHNDDNWIETSVISKISSINNEKHNVKKTMADTANLIEKKANINILKQGVNSWSKSLNIHSSGYALIFTSKTYLMNFIHACELLGYKSTHFRCTYSNQLTEEQQETIKISLKKLGFTGLSAEKIRRLQNGIGDERLNYIKLTLNKYTPHEKPKNLSALNQIFFILAIKFFL